MAEDEESMAEDEESMAENEVAEEMALVVGVKKLDLVVYQQVLHPLAPLILSTKTRMVFALCVMMVRTFQPELKLVNCLSSFSMIALCTEYCDAHMHTLKQRKKAKRDDTSSS